MSEWISVEDRLPDEGVPVWGATLGQFPMIAALQVDADGWLWGEVYAHYPSDGKWACDYEVNDDYSWITHWMPLPEPPKGEE